MPTDSNEDDNIDKLLAELKGETSEESNTSKPKKQYKNDDNNTYEVNDDTKSDEDW